MTRKDKTSYGGNNNHHSHKRKQSQRRHWLVDHIQNSKAIKYVAGIATVWTLVMTSALLIGSLSSGGTSKLAQAAPLNLGPVGPGTGSGAVNATVQKLYSVNGGPFQANVTASPTDTVTVRLNYNNTGDKADPAASIQDSIPQGFTFVNGSGRAKYVDAPEVSLPNSLFANPNQISVAPHAGYYGIPLTATSGVLEMGKKRAVNLGQCRMERPGSQSTDFLTIPIQTNANGKSIARAGNSETEVDMAANTNCNIPSGWTNTTLGEQQNSEIIDIVANRYLNLGQCRLERPGSQSEDFLTVPLQTTANGKSIARSSNNETPVDMAANSTCSAPSGWTNVTGGEQQFSAVIDMLGNRYLHLGQCRMERPGSQSTDFLTIPIQTVSNGKSVATATNGSASVDMSTNSNCNIPSGWTNVTGGEQQNSAVIDLLDPQRGYGYIEYQIRPNSGIQSGQHGTNGGMTGQSFSPANGGGLNGITIQGAGTPLTVDRIQSSNCPNPSTIQTGQSTSCTFTLDGSGPFTSGNIVATVDFPGEQMIFACTVTGNTGTCPMSGMTRVGGPYPVSFRDQTGATKAAQPGQLTITSDSSSSSVSSSSVSSSSMSSSSTMSSSSSSMTSSTSSAPTVITPDMLGSANCSLTNPVVIGSTFTCSFPINGTGPFTLPNGTTANVGGLSGVGNCTLNSTANTVDCTGIPTTGGQPGNDQPVMVTLPGSSPTNKGTVDLINPTSSISSSSVSSSVMSSSSMSSSMSSSSSTSNSGDADGDGIPDVVECNASMSNCPDYDGDGKPNYMDKDSDNDGIADATEKGQNGNSPVNTDGDSNPDYIDNDADGDKIPDTIEGDDANHDGRNDRNITPDGQGRIPSITDTNNDGLDDRYDPAITGGRNPALQDTDSDGKKDWVDKDDDGDGVHSNNEDPNNNNNPADDDTDSDGIPNYLDKDDDGDGVDSGYENPDPNNNGDDDDAQNTDGDNRPDYLDPDDDGDGIPTQNETPDPNDDGNPSDANDNDQDGTPDYLDPTNGNNQTPLNPGDIPGLNVTCNAAMVNSTTTCYFNLPPNKSLPNDFKLGIGNGIPGGSCTVNSSRVVTCTGVNTGSNAGVQPIFGQIGSNPKVDTGEDAQVLNPGLGDGELPRSGGGLAAGILTLVVTAGIAYGLYRGSRKNNLGDKVQ